MPCSTAYPEVTHIGRDVALSSAAMGSTSERERCWWAGGATPSDALMAAYHDDEWGIPVDDDVELFERLILECFQAGLSWRRFSTSVSRSEPRSAASIPPSWRAFDDADRARLMADAGIVRNRAKIDAAIGNAAAFLEVVRVLRLVRGLSRDDHPAPAASPTAGTHDDVTDFRQRRLRRMPSRRI